MTDITYRADASGMVAHGTTIFTRIAAWCGQFADRLRRFAHREIAVTTSFPCFLALISPAGA